MIDLAIHATVVLLLVLINFGLVLWHLLSETNNDTLGGVLFINSLLALAGTGFLLAHATQVFRVLGAL